MSSWDNTAGIVNRLGTGRPTNCGVGYWHGQKNFCSTSVQTSSAAHQPSYSAGNGRLYLEIRQPQCEGEHSPPSSVTKVTNELSHLQSWPVQEQLYFYLINS